MERNRKINGLCIKKKFLNDYLKFGNDINRLELQLAEVRLHKVSPSNSYTGIPNSKLKTDLSDYVAKIEQIEQEIIQFKYERICSFQRVQCCVEAMEDDREKDVLTYRYLRNMKWEDIANTMMFSLQHIYRIHTKAIEHFNIK